MPPTKIVYKLNRFSLDLGDVKINNFRSVSGLSFAIEPVRGNGVLESGRHYQVTRPGYAAQPRQLVFHTQVLDPVVWAWHLDAWDGKTTAMKDGSVVIYDGAWAENVRFNFSGAWPSSITWDVMQAGSSAPMEITVVLEVQALVVG